jgi:hypothetical protein
MPSLAAIKVAFGVDDDVFQSIIDTVHETCSKEADHLERFQGKDFDAFLDDVYYPKLKSIYPSVFRSTLGSAADVNTQHVRFLLSSRKRNMTRQVKGDKTPSQQSSPNKCQDKPANSASTSSSRPRLNPINTADVHRSNEEGSANESANPVDFSISQPEPFASPAMFQPSPMLPCFQVCDTLDLTLFTVKTRFQTSTGEMRLISRVMLKSLIPSNDTHFRPTEQMGRAAIQAISFQVWKDGVAQDLHAERLASLEFWDIRVKFPAETSTESLHITNMSPEAADRTFQAVVSEFISRGPISAVIEIELHPLETGMAPLS